MEGFISSYCRGGGEGEFVVLHRKSYSVGFVPFFVVYRIASSPFPLLFFMET